MSRDFFLDVTGWVDDIDPGLTDMDMSEEVHRFRRAETWSSDVGNFSYLYTHNNETLRELILFTVQVEYVFGILYSLIALVGTVANALVLIKMCISSSLRTPSNYFITNLAISDLVVLIALLTTRSFAMYLQDIYNIEWVLHSLQYLQHVCIQSTSLVLAAMSYTRHQFVIHPLKARATWTSARVWRICGAVWFVSMFIYSPILFGVLDTAEIGLKKLVPIPLHRRIFSTVRLFPMFIIPGTIVLLSYARIVIANRKRDAFLRRKSMKTANDTFKKNVDKQTRKLTKMVVIIVLVFFIGWGPYQIYLSALDLRPYFLQKTPLRWKVVVMLSGILRIPAYLGCTINPFVYAHSNPAFLKITKAKVKSTLKKTNTTPLTTPRNSCQIIHEQNHVA